MPWHIDISDWAVHPPTPRYSTLIVYAKVKSRPLFIIIIFTLSVEISARPSAAGEPFSVQHQAATSEQAKLCRDFDDCFFGSVSELRHDRYCRMMRPHSAAGSRAALHRLW